MAHQIRINTSVNRESKSRTAGKALDLAPDRVSSRGSQIDDFIGALANEYENKRARQVSEWERLLRRDVPERSYRAVF
jgi:hypothetical protein